MPSLSRVRRTGKWERSTRRMISSFSDAGYLMRRIPQPRSCFFKQPVLKRQVGNQLLHVTHLAAQLFDFARGDLPGGVARKPLLAGRQKLLRPAVIQTLGAPLTAAQLGNAVLATQTCQDNSDLLLSRILLARLASDTRPLPPKRETSLWGPTSRGT